uniref:Death domain-containing protein n=1 Tax=Chelonoidis abingdonii TaxID=106734 RepID=A0A8C0GDD5_CHEAB
MVLAMLLPLLLCLLPSALLPPGACTTARKSPSKKCSSLQFWHQEAQACIPCENGYANKVPLHGDHAYTHPVLITPALCPTGLWGAPLQHLLDDPDVLEELIMLLDPEGKAGAGTRHLAARYGLSATWIDYAYSLRSTRSPLRATLETVAARQPDATLGQLAGLLAAMGRMDALQVLEGVQVGV